MGKVVLDAQTRAKLNGLTERLELYDEQGNLLGYYVPPGQFRALAAPPARGPFSDEEVEAAFRQTGPGRPLADILAGLRHK